MVRKCRAQSANLAPRFLAEEKEERRELLPYQGKRFSLYVRVHFPFGLDLYLLSPHAAVAHPDQVRPVPARSAFSAHCPLPTPPLHLGTPSSLSLPSFLPDCTGQTWQDQKEDPRETRDPEERKKDPVLPVQSVVPPGPAWVGERHPSQRKSLNPPNSSSVFFLEPYLLESSKDITCSIQNFPLSFFPFSLSPPPPSPSPSPLVLRAITHHSLPLFGESLPPKTKLRSSH